MSRQHNRIFTNVYINNIDASVEESTLRKLCEEKGGKVVSLVIIRDKVTKASLGYGFCSFSTPQEAVRAVNNLGNYLLGTKRLTLSRASSRSERSSFLNSVRQQQEESTASQAGCTNVYVKGLAAYEEEEGLRKMFMRFGEIINVRVMRNPQGKSRGFGFVSFKKVADAKRAVTEMNGCKMGSHVLGVSFYESKKVRSERLASLHSTSSSPQPQAQQNEAEKELGPRPAFSPAQTQQLFSCAAGSLSSLDAVLESPKCSSPKYFSSQSYITNFGYSSSSNSSESGSQSRSESVDVVSDYSSDDSLSQSPEAYANAFEQASPLALSTSSSNSGSVGSSRSPSPCESDADLEERCMKNTILLSGLRFVSEPKEVRQIFYDFRNVRAEPVTSSRAVMSGEWKVSFESPSDAKRALEIVSQNLYVRNRKVSARRLF